MAVARIETGGNEPDERGATLSTDAIFDTLSNRRRRYVLHYLKRTREQVTIRDLSEQLAAWELGVDRSAVRPKERKRLYTALHQTHLPKMDGDGVVSYDRNRGVVSLNGSLEQFDIYFDMVGRAEVPWSQFYLALGGLVTSIATLAFLGVAPFQSLTGPTSLVVGAVLFTTVACCHVFVDRRRVLGATDDPPELATADLGGRAGAGPTSD